MPNPTSLHAAVDPQARITKLLSKSLLPLLLSASLCGCLSTSQEEGRTLRAQMEAQGRQLQAQDERLVTIEGRLEEAGSRLQAQADELSRLLEEASAVLRRNSADQGLVIQQLQEQLGAIEGQIAETRNLAEASDRQSAANRREMTENRREVDERWQALELRLDQIARAAGMDVTLHSNAIPADRDEHFRAATQALRVNNHSDARALFREFISRYPTDERADDARYSIGSSYLRQGQPAAALGELRRILVDHREGDMVGRALADMAEAFLQVRACGDARAALEALIEREPRSTLGTRARARLRELARLPETACE
jgi:TolA-binding protein